MTNETFIFCKNKKLYPVKVKDIVCIERRKRIIRICMSDKTSLEVTNCSLTGIMREIKSDRLQLCSRSAIVNRDYIFAVDPTNYYIILKEEMGTLDLGCFFKEKVLAGLAERDDEFILRIDNIRYVIRAEEFLYAKSSKRVLHIFLRDGRELQVSQKPIEYILQQVDKEWMIRCVRGVVVNRKCIEKIDLENRKLVLSNGELIGIGKSYMNVLKKRVLYRGVNVSE